MCTAVLLVDVYGGITCLCVRRYYLSMCTAVLLVMCTAVLLVDEPALRMHGLGPYCVRK